MDIYACGNNAWRQLEIPTQGYPSWPNVIEQREIESRLLGMAGEPEDYYQFRKVLSVERDAKVLGVWAGLSWTVVKTSSDLYVAGQLAQDFPISENPDLNLVGISGNGTVQSLQDFISLVTQDKRPPFEGDLKVKQLVANQACWAALCDDGSVWTWGDTRFPGCLGREIDSENPSSSPTIIPALLPSNINTNVTKIASGGYITAALTCTNDVYIWGSRDPGSSCILIPDLSGDPTPLIIADPKDPTQEFDFLDIAIGYKHIIILTTTQRIFTIGQNTNGQVGLSAAQTDGTDSLPEWKEIQIPWPSSHSRSVAAEEEGRGKAPPKSGGREMVGVASGGNTSFVISACGGE